MNGSAGFKTLAAIVLAAGLSQRMGSENKLLKPLSGRPLLAYATARLAALDLKEVIVVARPDADEIRSLLPASFTFIENREAAKGMGRSIAKGAQSLNAKVRGVFIVLGDMPFIQISDYERLAKAFELLDDDAVCIPCFEGKRGHPVLFGCAHIEALTKLAEDRGARSVLDDNAARIHEIDGCSEGVLFDVDDPSAFAEAERKLAGMFGDMD